MDLATLLGMPSNAAAMIGSGGDPEMSLPRGRTAPTTPRPVTPEVRRQAAHAARTGAMFGMGMLPVVGETMDAADLARAAQSRDMLGMLLSGGSLALPFLPGPSRWLDVARGAPDAPTGGRTVFRGDTGSEERITGGISEGDLFVTPYEDVARLYGDRITQFDLPETARVLVEGTPEFARITGRRRGPLLRTMRSNENLRDAATDAVNKAREAGYDAVEFNSMRDLGIAVINPDILRARRASD